MKRIALIGMPNTGKSTLFNRLSGASARVGNWPGITVDLMTAKILAGGHIVELVDLPGLYDLHGFSDDEHVVRHFLSEHPVDLLLIVLNASQIDRQLSLALQIKALGLPMLLCLNMIDEAKRAGISIDVDKMSQQLGIPVFPISAKYGDNCQQAINLAGNLIHQTGELVSPAKISQQLEADIAIEHEMESIVKSSVQMPLKMNDQLTTSIDRILLHPWLGLPIFFATLFAIFQLIFTLGTPLQDFVAWILDLFKLHALEPAVSSLPKWLSALIVNGIYDGVGTVAAFVPIVVLFFLIMSIVEDSGYMSRAAFLMDALMAKMGMDGRGFVMVLMGFGCNVPALMGTRVMRSRAMRLLTMLVIPLSLCSARLQVFVFMTAILFSANQAPFVLFAMYLMSFITILITALIFKKHYKNQEPFILELPPYRFPTIRQILLRGWHEVRHFLTRASKFIVAGVVLVWALSNYPAGLATASAETYAGQIGAFFEPVLSPIGIDGKLAITLIFGFVAKEIVVGSLAVIYGLQGDALTTMIASQLDWVQGVSFMLFTLIYTPCLSTIATMRNESKSYTYTGIAIAWSLILAWLVSFVFYQGARWLGY